MSTESGRPCTGTSTSTSTSSGAGTDAGTGAGMEFDAVVLGAGISGLVSAAILIERGAGRVLLLDEYEHVGGNHIDRTIGEYTFDVGSLIFQDDSPLLRYFPELLERYVAIDPSWGKVTPQSVIAPYPFSVRDDFFGAGPKECLLMLLSVARCRIVYRHLNSARDFARFWIGARLLHRSGLEKYMERFCGLPADKIDVAFARKRMMWIAENSSVITLARRTLQRVRHRSAPGVTNQQLARPRAGFAHLYEPAVEHLAAGGVSIALGVHLDSVRRLDHRFSVSAGVNNYVTDRVISTIPIDRARTACGLPLQQPLPAVTLISLFFSFAGDRGFAQSVLYNFSFDGSWKRLTMYSDFYGSAGGREFFTVEVVADRVRQQVPEAASDFTEHVAANNLFTGDLRLEGSHTLEQAYPIYTDGAGERAERAIAELREFGLESFGRQGGFQYQPTARVSTQEAETALGAR